LKLATILDIEESFTNYVCKTALKLQTVKNAEYKTPEDFLNINDLEIFDKLLEIDDKYSNVNKKHSSSLHSLFSALDLNTVNK
jgi:hypothetical protein